MQGYEVSAAVRRPSAELCRAGVARSNGPAQAGRGPGYLSDPDGVDLVPPDSLLVTHRATMGAP